MMSKVAKKVEPILEPQEVDVLCGRGGMSNHHPGNEWYRRLIRSNRPLYRACPKHTKLLVSKAIVQAVEQQGGRFLEHDKKNGYWYAVPYKRAVDKTSQGLRERDREGDDDDDDGREETMDAANVPESFQGNRPGAPNLNDLAAVAVAHANRTAPRMTARGATQQQPQLLQGRRPQQALPQLSQQQQQQVGTGGSNSNSSNHAAAMMSMMMPTRTSADTTTNNNNNMIHTDAMMIQNQHHPSKRPSTADGGSSLYNMNHKRPRMEEQQQRQQQQQQSSSSSSLLVDDVDDMVLPTSLQARQSSMFRLMKQTQFLTPGMSRAWAALDSSSSGLPSSSSLLMSSITAANTQQRMPSLGGLTYPTSFNNLGPLPSSSSSSMPFANNNNRKRTMEPDNLYGVPAPLPPPPQPGLFSVSSTGSLFGQSTFFDQTNNNNSNGMSTSQQQQQQQPTMGSTAFPPPQQQQQHQQENLIHNSNHDSSATALAAPPLSRLTSQVSDWLTSFWPLQGKAEAEKTGQVGFPSDPLEGDPFVELNNSSAVANSVQTNLPFPKSRLPPEIQKQIKIPAPMNLEANKPVITTVPPPVRAAPTSTAPSATSHHRPHHPRSRQENKHNMILPTAINTAATAITTTTSGSSTGSTSFSNRSMGMSKRKARPSLPPLPYGTNLLEQDQEPSFVGTANVAALPREKMMLQYNGGGVGAASSSLSLLDSNNHVNNAALTLPQQLSNDNDLPMPTELEQSVSTTLLKLASSPSRLFSGLTSFFSPSTSTTMTTGGTASGNNGESTMFPNQNQQQQQQESALQQVHMIRRGSKSSRSLLDDDEDTPMEARLRTLPSYQLE